MAEDAAAPAPAPAPAPALKKKSAPAFKSVRLHVQNLGEDITKQELLALFSTHGTVKGGDVKLGADGKSRGFGFVLMATEDDAVKAIAGLSGGTFTVVRAPEKETINGKGEGKGKDSGAEAQSGSKEARSGNKSKTQRADPMSAYPQQQYGMYPDPYAMDPMMMQMQMQQMYMMQMMQMQMQMTGMVQQHQPELPAANEKVAAKKGKFKGKRIGTKVEGTFTGKLKSINSKDESGYGFIDCVATMVSYGRDVFVSSELVPPGAKIGDQLQFNVTLNEKGQPRANNVTRI